MQTAACNMFRPKFSTKKASVWKAVHVGRHLCKKCLSSPFSFVMHAGKRLAGWISVLFQENGNHKFFSSLIRSTLQTNEYTLLATFTSQQASHKNYAIMNISLNLLQSVCNNQPNYIIYLTIKCERYLFVMHVHLLLPWCTCYSKIKLDNETLVELPN